jgi:peptidylprolyl isomerase
MTRILSAIALVLLVSASAGAQRTLKMLPPPSDVAAPPADAQKTASGLASKVLTAGTGKVHPTANSRVLVHYTGWTTDGKMFDSSVQRGEPIAFPLNGVIKGWTEGVQLMVVGEKRRFWIPGNLAYDNSTRPGAPKGMLVFDIELLEIQ